MTSVPFNANWQQYSHGPFIWKIVDDGGNMIGSFVEPDKDPFDFSKQEFTQISNITFYCDENVKDEWKLAESE